MGAGAKANKNLVVGFAFSLVLALLSYNYFEKTILKLKDKYAPLTK